MIDAGRRAIPTIVADPAALRGSRRSIARRMIEDAMHQADFNQSQAALLLGLSEQMIRPLVTFEQ